MKEDLLRAKRQLERIQASCDHNWGDKKRDVKIEANMRYTAKQNDSVQLVGGKALVVPFEYQEPVRTGGVRRIPCWSMECTCCGEKRYSLKKSGQFTGEAYLLGKVR